MELVHFSDGSKTCISVDDLMSNESINGQIGIVERFVPA